MLKQVFFLFILFLKIFKFYIFKKIDEENFHILTSNNLGKGGFTYLK